MMNIQQFAKSLFLLTLLVLVACEQAPSVDQRTHLVLSDGEIIGFEADDYTHSWLGIPYAEPPVGDLRWRAPQPAVKWQGVKQALAFGPACVQLPGMSAGDNAPESEVVVGSEDCLTLNVFAPKSVVSSDSLSADINQKKLPVMVWIHGGGNAVGSAQVYNDMSALTKRGVIVVTINYRLGLLGWFRHPSLRGEDATLADQSGNYGTLDIIEALHWVQNNIANFGGDADNVTIFGESAGARNVWTMVASPLAKGLFHRAIAQSGSIRVMEAGKAEKHNPEARDYFPYKNNTAEIIKALFPDIDSVIHTQQVSAKQLRDLSIDELYSSVNDGTAIIGMYHQPELFVDGHVFTQPTIELLENPTSYNSVPMIVGSNRDENKLFEMMLMNERWYDKKLGFIPALKDAERYDHVTGYDGDIWRAMSVDLPAEVITNNGGEPVYAYRFDYDELITWPIDLKSMVGAAHGLEMSFIFNMLDDFPTKFMYKKSDSLRTLSDAMADYWVAFAYTGNPGKGLNHDQAAWISWQPESPILVFDGELDGGIRMDSSAMTAASIKQRLVNDDMLSQDEKCSLYMSMFLIGYQTPHAYNEQEYLSLGESGCRLN